MAYRLQGLRCCDLLTLITALQAGVWMSSYFFYNERLQLNNRSVCYCMLGTFAASTSREEIVSRSFGTCNSWYLLVWQWLVWRREFLRVNRERQISMLSFLQMVMPSCPLSTASLAVRFGGHLWMSKNIHTWISGNSIDMLICRRRWSYKVVFLTIGEWPTASLWRLSSRLFGLSFCVCKYRYMQILRRGPSPLHFFHGVTKANRTYRTYRTSV